MSYRNDIRKSSWVGIWVSQDEVENGATKRSHLPVEVPNNQRFVIGLPTNTVCSITQL